MRRCSVLWSGVLVASCAALAQAAPLNFAFTSVQSNWDGAVFSTHINPPASSGSVSRATPVSQATFVPDTLVPGLGWTPEGGAVALTMALSNVQPGSADALGTLLLTDTDGDQITAVIAGTWDRGISQTFSGSLSSIAFVQNAVGEPLTFDGHAGTAMDMTGLLPLTGGTLIELVVNGTWFSEGTYRDVPSGVDGNMVPEPAGIMLLLVGAGLMSLRR